MSDFQLSRRGFSSGAAASLMLAHGARANPDAGKSAGKPERGGGGDLSIDMTLQFLPLTVQRLAYYYIATMLIVTNSALVYMFMRNGVLRRLENRLNIGAIPLLGALTRASYSRSDFTPANEVGSLYLYNQTTLILDLRPEPSPAPSSPGSLSGPATLLNAPSGASAPYSATPIGGQINIEARLQEADRQFTRDVGASFELDRGRGGQTISSVVTFNDDFSFVSSGKQFYSAFTPFEIDFHNQTRDAPGKARSVPMLGQVPILGQLIGKAHMTEKDQQSLLVVVKPSVVAGYE